MVKEQGRVKVLCEWYRRLSLDALNVQHASVGEERERGQRALGRLGVRCPECTVSETTFYIKHHAEKEEWPIRQSSPKRLQTQVRA